MPSGLPASIGQLPDWNRRKARLKRVRQSIQALEIALDRNDFRYEPEREAARVKVERLKAEEAKAVAFISQLQAECQELTSA